MAGPTMACERIAGRLGSLLRHLLATLLATTALGIVAGHAVDGTWTGASSTEWTDGTNWTSTPDVPDGTATFTNTGPATVDSNGLVTIGAVVFTAAPNAQTYTVNTNDIFVVNGAGISNNSTNVQMFNVGSSMMFLNSSSASAGSNVVTCNVNGGAISFNDTSTAGTADITNGAIGGGDIEFNGSSNAGTATILNNAVINFNDTSSASGSSITNSATGFVTFNTSSTAGTAAIDNSGTLIFSNSATAGNATITTENGDTTSFTGTSTGGNARFITNAGGTFDMSGLVSTGMTAGSIEGAGDGAKTLTTGGNNLSTQVDGVISGAGGGLTKVGTGALTLTGINTYTGATTISGGTLALSGFGSIASSSLVTVNATLDISAITPSFAAITTPTGGSSGIVNLGTKGLFITNGSTEFAGVIQGTGGLEVGGGTQTLTGVNTYTGATNLIRGTLVVDGSILNSPNTVNAGGTLAGTGTVGSVAVNGGTLAPGSAASPFGPLTVNGGLIFTAVSTYLVQVSSTNAGLTNVTGAADLGNATVHANFTSGTLKKQYTILNAAGGLAGTTFNSAIVSNMPTVSATLSYDPNNVFLNVNVDFAQAGGLNTNQRNVANTLTNFFNTTGGIPAAFAALTPAGLTTASGEPGTGINQSAINADGQFLNPDARSDCDRPFGRLRQGGQRRAIRRQ